MSEDWDVGFRVWVTSTDSGSGWRRPRLVSAGVQITQRVHKSHTGCRTTQTLTPCQRPRGWISSRIYWHHVPIKNILITQTVGPQKKKVN